MKKLLLLLSLILSSCVILDQTNSDRDKLAKENFQDLNGLYSAKPDSSWKPTLADHLIVNYYLDHLSTDPDDTLEVELKVLSKKELKVRVFRNQTLEFEKVLKGKLRNNYFVLNRQKHMETDLYGILRTPTLQKTRIGWLNDDLIIDAEVAWYPSILIIPLFYVKNEHYYEKFEKIKQIPIGPSPNHNKW